MKYDETSVKKLVQESTMIAIDGQVYDIDWCDSEFFQGSSDDGEVQQFSYDDVDLDRDLLYKVILLNP
jgi:hypothetical protein